MLAFEGGVAVIIGTRAIRVSPADVWGHGRRVTAATNDRRGASRLCPLGKRGYQAWLHERGGQGRH